MAGFRAKIEDMGPGWLRVSFTPDAAARIRPLIQKARAGNRDLAVELALYSPARSLDQNRLYWALVRILGYEAYQEHGHDDEVHEALLYLAAPRVYDPISKRDVPKRSKHMTVGEFCRLIEAAFGEIADLGVELSGAEDIGGYWYQFNSLRAAQPKDPLEYSGIEEYARRVRFCEATMVYLGDSGHVAHIRSRGAGGCDEGWNLLRLSDPVHLLFQHMKGWEAVMKRYPHLAWKIKRALDTPEGGRPGETTTEAGKIDSRAPGDVLGAIQEGEA